MLWSCVRSNSAADDGLWGIQVDFRCVTAYRPAGTRFRSVPASRYTSLYNYFPSYSAQFIMHASALMCSGWKYNIKNIVKKFQTYSELNSDSTKHLQKAGLKKCNSRMIIYSSSASCSGKLNQVRRQASDQQFRVRERTDWPRFGPLAAVRSQTEHATLSGGSHRQNIELFLNVRRRKC